MRYGVERNKYEYLIFISMEKPHVAQLLRNARTFYETRRFITVLATARLWSLF
jgi:hypothetical protein